MPHVLIQAGHYPDGGGAPGEAVWTWKLAHLIRDRLKNALIQTTIVGHWYQRPLPAEARNDYDLALFLHYDASVYTINSGCFADRWSEESQALYADSFVGIWERLYPAMTGIPLKNSRRNANTAQYYGYAALSYVTPGVLLEHGCGATNEVLSGGRRHPLGGDIGVLHGQIGLIAAADARAVEKFLGVGEAVSMLTEEERAALATLHALGWRSDSITAAVERIGALEEVLRRHGGYAPELQRQTLRLARRREIAALLAADMPA